jgi:hypothetical protein
VVAHRRRRSEWKKMASGDRATSSSRVSGGVGPSGGGSPEVASGSHEEGRAGAGNFGTLPATKSNHPG